MYLLAVLIGLGTGIAGGLLGIGGGIIMIPALVLLLGFNQHQALGTTLAAMIPPIGFFAAYEYYKNGHVNVPVAALIALGFIVGGFFGARIAVSIDAELLKRIFGAILLLISLKFLF